MASAGAPRPQDDRGDEPPLLRIERDGTGDGLRLRTRHEEPRLRPRLPRTATRTAHPGTAVRHDGALFEVIAVEPALPPHPWCYRLAPWDDASTVRTVLDLSDEGLGRYENDVRAERERLGRLGRLSLLLPLVGMLPAAHLQRLREEVGLNPERAVNVSAICLLVPSFCIATYGTLLYLAPALALFFGGGDGPALAPPLPLLLAAAYFAAESSIRLRAAGPQGSAPVVALVALLQALGVVKPPPDLARAAAERRADAAARAHLVDRVVKMPAPGGRGAELRIESVLAKTWPDGACIRHDDHFYVVSGASTEERHGVVRHVYHLVEADAEARARPIVFYRPDDALAERHREEERHRQGRAHTLLPLIGFLPGDEQERRGRDQGFDPAEATRTSAWVEILFALLCVVFAFRNADSPVLPLALASALAVEGWLRLRRLGRDRKPSGSWLLAWWPRR